MGRGFNLGFWFNLDERFSLGLNYGQLTVPYRQNLVENDTLVGVGMSPNDVNRFGLLTRYLVSDLAREDGFELHFGLGAWSHTVQRAGFDPFDPNTSTGIYRDTWTLSYYAEAGVYYYRPLTDWLDFSVGLRTAVVFDIFRFASRWTDQGLNYSTLNMGLQFNLP